MKEANQPNEMQTWQVIAPATGQCIGQLTETPVREIPAMYSRAREAYLEWSGIPLEERLGYFRRLRQELIEQVDEIVDVVARSTGKVPVEVLTAEWMPLLDMLHYIDKHANRILRRQKQPTPLFFFGKRSYVEYLPRGVILVISPWNYPFQLALVPMLSALISGNTVILKPSEVTPLVGALIETIFQRCGFPEGVVQVAHGGKELGAALTSAKPDYIFFTGSVQTGKIIQAQAARDLIPTTLELGGKDPMIVCADANLRRAAKGAVWGAFTNSGQVCMSVERLYVERVIYDEFVAGVIAEVNQLRQGTDVDDDLGSMTFPAQIRLVKDHVEDALAHGARLVTGTPPAQWKEGMFLPPLVLTGVGQDFRVVQEETFGPVLPIIPFDTEEEAVQLANDSTFGLNASVWSADLPKAERIASRLVSGAVVINNVIISAVNPHLPFGGVKHSGLGRYHSATGLRTFCHEKAILADRGKQQSEVNWYPYKGKFTLMKEALTLYFGGKTIRSIPKMLKLLGKQVR